MNFKEIFEDIKDLAQDVVENPEAWIEGIKQEWEALDPEDRAFIEATLIAIPARRYATWYWKRKGAPEWAAKGFSSLGTAISLAAAKHAFEQRQRERKAKSNAKKSAATFN